MKRILKLILIFTFICGFSQEKISKPVFIEKKKEIKLITAKEQKSNVQNLGSKKRNIIIDYDRERISEREKAKNAQIAEIERQNQLKTDRITLENMQKQRELYNKNLMWCKNMIEINGLISCKNDVFCKKQVIEKLQLALSYFDGNEAKNLLQQIQ